MLGIFGVKRDSLPPSSIRVNTPIDYNGWKSAETALLKTQREKTEALMERQRRSFLC